MRNPFDSFSKIRLFLSDLFLPFLADKNRVLVLFFLLYFSASYFVWKKYEWNPTSQINFGKEFADQNAPETPPGAVVFLGEEGNLGAGYDGQIFYYYSRMLSGFHLDWPKGFETSFRAPRIGYPLLVSPFGWFGRYGTVFGMYFLHLLLLPLSFLALRDLLSEDKKYLAGLYLLSPFTLGSYVLLVSDTVMIGLVVLSYWAYKKKRYLLFSLLGGLAILTKEQALFLLFPLGLEALFRKEWRNAIWVGSVLILPVLWSAYLRTQFPAWSPAHLGSFFEPFSGISAYLREIYEAVSGVDGGLKALVKKFSRFPLLVLLASGVFLLFRGRIRLGIPFRIGFGITMFTICGAGYILYWATYENVSRMFAVSLPLLALWQSEDEELPGWIYWTLCGFVLFFFFIKLAIVSQPLRFLVW